MAAMTVLAIGVDVSSSANRRWRERGMFLKFAQTLSEAIPLLRYGDFDLCLLGSSVSMLSRAKLAAYLQQTRHLSIPVISVVDGSGSIEEFRTLLDRHQNRALLESLQELLLEAKHSVSMADHWRSVRTLE